MLFRDDLKELLKDPEFAKAYEEVDAEVRLAVAVAEARERAGMAQAELAKKLHTKQSNISRLQRGAPSHSRPFGIKSLGRGMHRVRVGDWRVIYEIDDASLVVRIARIVRRNERTYGFI